MRLAAQKADNWHMRFHERALNLVFKKGVKRPDKSNAIDLLCSGLVPEDGFEREEFDRMFEEAPQPFTSDERKAFLKTLKGVSVCSDAFVSDSCPVYLHRGHRSRHAGNIEFGGSIANFNGPYEYEFVTQH